MANCKRVSRHRWQDEPVVKTIYIFWRDIPAQVIMQRGRQRAKGTLSSRFQKAIDSAAMRAGKGSSDAYISEWRRQTAVDKSDGELSRLVELEIERIESEYSDDRLTRLIRSEGLDHA